MTHIELKKAKLLKTRCSWRSLGCIPPSEFMSIISVVNMSGDLFCERNSIYQHLSCLFMDQTERIEERIEIEISITKNSAVCVCVCASDNS